MRDSQLTPEMRRCLWRIYSFLIDLADEQEVVEETTETNTVNESSTTSAADKIESEST